MSVSRLCPGDYLGHLRLLMERTVLDISRWLCAGCPGNLHFHYVLDSSHDLEQDKSVEGTLLTAPGEGLSAERSLAERQAVLLLHDGKQTETTDRMLCGNLQERGTWHLLKNRKQNPSKHAAQSSSLSNKQTAAINSRAAQGSHRLLHSAQHSRSLRLREARI